MSQLIRLGPSATPDQATYVSYGYKRLYGNCTVISNARVLSPECSRRRVTLKEGGYWIDSPVRQMLLPRFSRWWADQMQQASCCSPFF